MFIRLWATFQLSGITGDGPHSMGFSTWGAVTLMREYEFHFSKPPDSCRNSNWFFTRMGRKRRDDAALKSVSNTRQTVTMAGLRWDGRAIPSRKSEGRLAVNAIAD